MPIIRWSFYRFFKYVLVSQFTPIGATTDMGMAVPGSLADKDEISLSEASARAGVVGNFLCAIFDEWVRKDVGKIFVEIFDYTGKLDGVLPASVLIPRNAVMWGVMIYGECSSRDFRFSGV